MNVSTPVRYLRPLAAALVLALLPAAHAQEKVAARPALEITDAQRAQMQTLFADVDRRMLAALERHPKQWKLMQEEFKRISSLKDDRQREREAAAYRARHAKFYAQVLADAKVSLPGLARQLNAILPGRKFAATDQYTLVSLVTTTPPASEPPPTPKDITEIVRDLDVDRSGSCRGAGGLVQVPGSRSTSTTAMATVAGGCHGSVALKRDMPGHGPANAFFSARVEWSQEGFALGVGGIAYGETTTRVTVGTDMPFQSRLSVVAPIAWYESKTDGGSRTVTSSQATFSSPLPVSFYTYGDAVSVAPSSTKARSTLVFENASVRYTN